MSEIPLQATQVDPRLQGRDHGHVTVFFESNVIVSVYFACRPCHCEGEFNICRERKNK